MFILSLLNVLSSTSLACALRTSPGAEIHRRGTGPRSTRGIEQLVLWPALIEQGPGRLGAGDGQRRRIEETGLYEDAGLVPVDVLVLDLAVLEADHDHDRDLDPASRRRNPGEHDLELPVVGEGHDELVDDLVLAHGPRDLLGLRVIRPLADEMARVELADAAGPAAARDRRDVMDMRLEGHRRHRGVEIQILELGPHVRVERRREIAHGPPSSSASALGLAVAQ